MSLTDAKIKSLKPGDKSHKHADGHGLYIEVKPNGSKLWRHAYRFQGRQKLLSYGPYPEVPLREARERRYEARKLLRDGLDPMAERKRVQPAGMTVEDLFNRWFDKRRAKWTERTAKDLRRDMQRLAMPKLGSLSVAEIMPVDIRAVINPIDTDKPVSARRTLQRLDSMFRFAVSEGLIAQNPCYGLGDNLTTHVTRHRKAIETDEELRLFLAKLSQSDAHQSVSASLWFTIYTAARRDEVRLAQWSEINAENDVWIVPAARTKTRAEHRVPLSRQAVALLEQQYECSGETYIFPTYRFSAPLSENAVLAMIKRLGYHDLTLHGFRASFSTWVGENIEERGYDPDVAELCLGHRIGTKANRPYARSPRLKERAALLQAWADHLDLQLAIGQGANITELKARA